MTGLPLLCTLALATQSIPPAHVGDFVAAYKSACDKSNHNPEPAAKSALGILISEVQDQLKRHPTASDKQIDFWLKPFFSAADPNHKGNPDIHDYASFNVSTITAPSCHFVVAQMGEIVRTAAFGQAGAPLILPKEFDANTEWLPLPRVLPKDFILMEEVSTIAQGMRIPMRLVWLKVQNHVATTVGEFKGETTLDYEQVEIHQGQVTAKTMDDPLALSVMTAGDFVLERDRTWDCSTGQLRLIRSEPKQLPLRAVDGAIFNAWHAKHPTRLQAKILHLFPKTEPAELDDWSESRRRNTATITLNSEAVFKLHKSHQGFKVIDVEARPQKT